MVDVAPGNAVIPEGYKGAEQGLNGAKQPGYKGMCPPSGARRYHFIVYALDNTLIFLKTTDEAGLGTRP